MGRDGYFLFCFNFILPLWLINIFFYFQRMILPLDHLLSKSLIAFACVCFCCKGLEDFYHTRWYSIEEIDGIEMYAKFDKYCNRIS